MLYCIEMLIHDLEAKKLIHPPKFLADNTHYLCMMGSNAYGCSSDSSDQDLYGFCMPPKEFMFPHLRGDIQGFGTQKQGFDQWSEHHIHDNGNEYDFSIYGIVKYFQLCMENNPNMLDSMFVPKRCIRHVTAIGQIVLDNRQLFLHKGSYHKFRGYAYAQLSKIRNKTSSKNPKRQATIDQFGMDVKFAYHIVRLALEAEQILVNHSLDLECNSAILKSIRNGEWTLARIEEWFTTKEKGLETLYVTSSLPDYPDETKIKNILMDCIEQHYGSISHSVVRETSIDSMLNDMQNLINQYRK
jgi:predicted nucleotidyltransferase